MTAPATPTGLIVKNQLDRTNARRSESIVLSWTANTESDLASYNVYRNYAPYGTFKLIATISSPTVTYTDNLTLTSSPSVPGDESGLFQSIDGMWYYRISAVNNTAEESTLTDPLSYIESDAYNTDVFSSTYSVGGVNISYQGSTKCSLPSNSGMLTYFNQIRDRNIWLLLNDGQDVWLYKRRKEGTKCSHWDDDVEQCADPLGKLEDHSDRCFGTGFVGGFYDPVRIKLRYISVASKIKVDQEGMKVHNEPKAWTIWAPQLANFDFILTNDGKRFEIQDVNTYRVRGGLVTHQDFNLIQKWYTDLISYVPVPSEL